MAQEGKSGDMNSTSRSEVEVSVVMVEGVISSVTVKEPSKALPAPVAAAQTEPVVRTEQGPMTRYYHMYKTWAGCSMATCDKLGIRMDVLQRAVTAILDKTPIVWTKLSDVYLTNGVVLELRTWVKRWYYYHATMTSDLILALFDVGIDETDMPGLRRKVERLVEEDRRLKKNKRASGVEMLRVFLETPFQWKGRRSEREVRGEEREEGEGEQEGRETEELEGMEIEEEEGENEGQEEERRDTRDEGRTEMRGKRKRGTREGQSQDGRREEDRKRRTRREGGGGGASISEPEGVRFENQLPDDLEGALLAIQRLRRELDDVRSKYKSEVGRCQNLQTQQESVERKLQFQMNLSAKLIADCKKSDRDVRKYRQRSTIRQKEVDVLKQNLKELKKKLRKCEQTLLASTTTRKTSDDTSDSDAESVCEYKEALEKCKGDLQDARMTLDSTKKKLEDEIKTKLVEAKKCEQKLEEAKKFEQARAKLESKISTLRKKIKNYQRRERYTIQNKDKMKEKMAQESKKHSAKVVSLRTEVKKLREELKEAQSLIEPDPEKVDVSFKQQSIYNSNVRGVYQDLLTNHGVSSRNCEGVVRTVLGGLTDINMKKVQLPKKTTAASMFYEGRKMTQIQVARALQEEGNTTLSSDGTTKFGHHYAAFDIYKESDGGSSSMMIGMRESVSGTAQTTLDTLLGLLHEITDMPGSTQTVNKIIANIKNTMSDRHVAEKKFNKLLKDYRQDLLPEIVDGWGEMNDAEKEQFTSMNNFFCGLHYLVGLADYASKTIKAWEEMIFGNDRVGAESLGGMHVERGECGTVRLVRTVCKSVQDRGCARSGKPVEFRTFLKSKGIEHVPLAPFKGNRFNILFLNGGGVFFLRSELKEFCEEQVEDHLKAVGADLRVSQYLAAARALGLIDKLVTAPLWRVINESSHIAEMNQQYANLHTCFVRWADDASQFMRGDDVLFEGKHNPDDPVFKSLVTPNAELDQMTKQVLELVFLTFCQVTENMLQDHLGSGEHAKMGEEQVRATQSVPRTNVGVERDFSMLDRLIHLKPSASMLVYESIIMGVKNKTSEWRKGLSVTDREELMEYARRSVTAQKEEYAKRAKHLWKERIEKRRSMQKAKEHVVTKCVKSEKVYADAMAKCGGIWLSEHEVHEKMRGACEEECVEMLQAQLEARRHLFQEKNVNGRLNLSEKGRKKGVKELKESVLQIIQEANKRGKRVEDEQEDDYAYACASDDKIGEYKSMVEEKRKKTPQKTTQSRRKKTTQSPGKKKQPKGNVTNEIKYENLVGKIVDHLTTLDNGDEGLYRATVISRCRKGLRFIYDREPEDTYDYTRAEIEEDLRNGDLKLTQLVIGDIIGRHIMHRFEVENDVVWCKGVISSATEGQECLVTYEEVDDDEDELESSWEGPLLEEYANNDVRFLQPE
ncbi:uncharacterized protein [Diadema antillarum]|uniref:uncharacterized protein n=1 Tax=Diadema antillarum TaxID=105358 RepID=UPI003A843D22